MSFKLIVVQFSSHWQTYQSLNKQIWKVVKRFNANSISKVRKLMVAGRGLTRSATLAGPMVWAGQVCPDYNGMVSPGLYLPRTKNALLCQMHDWISSATWHTFGEKYWFTFLFNLESPLSQCIQIAECRMTADYCSSLFLFLQFLSWDLCKSSQSNNDWPSTARGTLLPSPRR